jgi:hypothetical protein
MAEAREFEAAGQYASAAYKYGQALAIDPFYVPALVARGEMCAKIGDQVEAARMRGRAEAILMQADDS